MGDEPLLNPEVMAYYSQGRELSRLAATRRLEFVRTRELLERYVPPPHGRILDVGGGAGAYAVPLATAGHDVVLVDPVRAHRDGRSRDGSPREPAARARVVHDCVLPSSGELVDEFHAAGCRVKAVVAIEGPTSGMRDLDTWLDNHDRRAVLRRAIARVESEPSLLGCSSHLLVLARPLHD